jgi:hypothetical protein
VELQARIADVRKAGLSLASITYDPAPVLAEFAARRGIGFPLLSDAGSATIKQYGILNTTVPETNPVFRPLNERVPVYRRPFSLVQDMTLDPSREAAPILRGLKTMTITARLDYQACDDKLCFPPEVHRHTSRPASAQHRPEHRRDVHVEAHHRRHEVHHCRHHYRADQSACNRPTNVRVHHIPPWLNVPASAPKCVPGPVE